MPIRNYSILNFEFTIQNSKLKIAKGNNSKFKIQKSKLKYGKFSSNSGTP